MKPSRPRKWKQGVLGSGSQEAASIPGCLYPKRSRILCSPCVCLAWHGWSVSTFSTFSAAGHRSAQSMTDLLSCTGTVTSPCFNLLGKQSANDSSILSWLQVVSPSSDTRTCQKRSRGDVGQHPLLYIQPPPPIPRSPPPIPVTPPSEYPRDPPIPGDGPTP